MPEQHAQDPGSGGRSIVLVCDGAGWAGTERHVRGLMLGLAERGWQVHLAVSEDGPLVERARSAGIQTWIVPRPSLPQYLGGLTGLLRRLRPRIVHAHSGRVPCLAARLAGVPAVVETRHGLRERLYPLYGRLPAARRWEGMKSRLPDLTLTVCRADALWLEREGRLPADRIRTIANGIGRPAGSSPEAARADLGLPEGGALLGLVGRLSPQKAPERALDLLGRLASSGEAPGGGADPSRRPDWRLVVGGDGPLRPALERSARERGLADRVTWCGARDDAPALLAALDLLLLPSLWEGLPYVLLEALAAGVPVLAAPVGGVPEVLAGESLSSGCLEWDPGSWAERAVRLATSPGGRRAWSAAALRRAGDFGEEAMIDRIEAAYLELPAGA